jgi:hypothetical protein
MRIVVRIWRNSRAVCDCVMKVGNLDDSSNVVSFAVAYLSITWRNWSTVFFVSLGEAMLLFGQPREMLSAGGHLPPSEKLSTSTVGIAFGWGGPSEPLNLIEASPRKPKRAQMASTWDRPRKLKLYDSKKGPCTRLVFIRTVLIHLADKDLNICAKLKRGVGEDRYCNL